MRRHYEVTQQHHHLLCCEGGMAWNGCPETHIFRIDTFFDSVFFFKNNFQGGILSIQAGTRRTVTVCRRFLLETRIKLEKNERHDFQGGN